MTLTQPVEGSTSTDPRPVFSGAAGSEEGDGISISVKIYAGLSATGSPIDSVTTTRSGASWSTQASVTLSPDTYTAQAEQVDNAGNVGRSPPVSFTIRPLPASYRDVVLSDTPGGYWRLGEASGITAADQTGRGPGAYSGSPSLGQAGAIAGDPDTALGLDGVNDQVRVPASAFLSPTASLSLEAWLRPTQLPGYTATLVRKNLQYLLRVTYSGAIQLRLWRGGSYTELSTPTGIIGSGSWHHVVATYDGSTMRIYVNGVQRANRSLLGSLDTSNSALYLGSSGGYDYFNGHLDEIAVYAGALSAARVSAHYDGSASPTDVTPPTVTLKTPTAGSTMDARPGFGGTAGTLPGDSATTTIKVYAGAGTAGTPLQTLTTNRKSSGTFSVLASEPLASGTYTALAQQSDATGNTGMSQEKTFSVDAVSDPTLTTAGDIASCSSPGDEATADILDRLGGLVVPLGDTVYESGTPTEYANCYDPSWGRHLARSRPIVGDHEYDTPNAAGYYDYFGAAAGSPSEGYYSYDVGEWHVSALNSYCYEVGTCEAAMETWLEQDLEANPRTCTVVLLHEPLFSSGNIHGNNPGMQYLWQIMYTAGVDVVLSGSEHIYERFAPQRPSGVADPQRGIREFIVGTGGRGHYGIGTVKPNSEVRNADTFGVLRMTLHADSYDWKFVPEAGKTFTDSGSTGCH